MRKKSRGKKLYPEKSPAESIYNLCMVENCDRDACGLVFEKTACCYPHYTALVQHHLNRQYNRNQNNTHTLS